MSEVNKEEPTKDAQFFVRPMKSTTVESLSDQIANGLIAQVNAERATKGLRPLPK
jgi:hypothetical protein